MTFFTFDALCCVSLTLNSNTAMLLAYVFAETISQLALSDILQFWTGADAVPPCGFPGRLQLCFYSRSHVMLMTQRSCMWQMLVDSVSLPAGFGKVETSQVYTTCMCATCMCAAYSHCCECTDAVIKLLAYDRCDTVLVT